MLLQPPVSRTRRPPRGVGFARLALIGVGALTMSLAIVALDQRGAAIRTDASTLPDPTLMARAALGVQPLDETVAFWRARVDRAPADLPARRLLAGALMTQARGTGDLVLYEAAEIEARAAVAISPMSADALLGLGAARAAQHDFTTAARLARQVLDRDPESTAALISLGDAQFELGLYAAARRTYDRLELAVPNTPVTLSRAARIAALDGHPVRGVTLAKRALVRVGDLDLHPAEGAFFWFQLASYELAAGRTDDAALHLTRALMVDPGHLPSRELLARARAEQGNLREARGLYAKLTRDTPAADLFGDLAKVEERLGRRIDARTHLAEGLALGTGQLGRFPAERRHLAAFFADADPTIALTAAEQDYQDRRDIQSAGTLAWAQFRTGDVESADLHSREALRFGTQDAVLQAQGGLIAASLGHRARAITLLRDALDRRPNYDPTWAPIARSELTRLTS